MGKRAFQRVCRQRASIRERPRAASPFGGRSAHPEWARRRGTGAILRDPAKNTTNHRIRIPDAHCVPPCASVGRGENSPCLRNASHFGAASCRAFQCRGHNERIFYPESE
jgi:hypothetical protein